MLLVVSTVPGVSAVLLSAGMEARFHALATLLSAFFRGSGDRRLFCGLGRGRLAPGRPRLAVLALGLGQLRNFRSCLQLAPAFGDGLAVAVDHLRNFAIASSRIELENLDSQFALL